MQTRSLEGGEVIRLWIARSRAGISFSFICFGDLEWRGVLVRLCSASAICSDVDTPLDRMAKVLPAAEGAWERLTTTCVRLNGNTQLLNPGSATE
jgi:hypothetical protein